MAGLPARQPRPTAACGDGVGLAYCARRGIAAAQEPWVGFGAVLRVEDARDGVDLRKTTAVDAVQVVHARLGADGLAEADE